MKLNNTKFLLFRKSIVFFLSAFLLLGLCSQAGAQQNLEYKIKAAFLYNFAKFVEWPNLKNADPSLPFVLGVLGDDPFGSELDVIQNKIINGRRISIKRFSSLNDYEPCHILFINPGEKNILKETLLWLKNKDALTVGDAADFAKAGGMIGFVQKQKKVRFEINIAAAENKGLSISSNLLKLATIVDTEKEDEIAK
jgi:hypothetical protein